MIRFTCSVVFLLVFVLRAAPSHAAGDTLKLNRETCEAIFLKENLLLLAEKLQIPKAEAVVQQAKLWPNPNLTFDQVNFWATPKQTGGQEVVPPLFGNFGKNQQFGAEVEQLILTARKRSKLVALEQLGVEKASAYFEELLRTLKNDFRKGLTELQYLQRYEKTYHNQLSSIKQLISGYQRQVNDGHLPKRELIRLKALELAILDNLNELSEKKNEVQKDLKLWMRLSPTSVLILSEEDFSGKTTSIPLDIQQIIEIAKQQRPDLQAALLEKNYSQKRIDYEKARRMPDVTLKATYDRNGNTMLNFFGFGASIDLPFFDRNQGNIKHARIEADQATKHVDFQNERIENEVVLAYRNLMGVLALSTQIEDGYEDSLDELLDAYTRNFSDRNISMLEFLDFLDAYLENKKIILSTQKAINDRKEELNYSVGQDVF